MCLTAALHFFSPDLPRSRFSPILAWLALLVALATGASAAEASTPTATPLEVVQAYVAAANQGDLEAFLALYAPDIRKFKFPGTLASQGKDHMREVYTRSFAQKRGIHIETVGTIVLGDKVVCHDHVTGLPDGKTADEVTVYQIQDSLITNIEYVERSDH